MDVLCPRCGEPFDLYTVQHEFTAKEREDFWTGKGCWCCSGRSDEEITEQAQAT